MSRELHVIKEAPRATSQPQPSTDLLRAILNALQDRGDRMLKPALAQRIGQPEFRLPGVIASLRRVMNVDGYPVITFEEASGTVCLNRQLLKTQFEIE